LIVGTSIPISTIIYFNQGWLSFAMFSFLPLCLLMIFGFGLYAESKAILELNDTTAIFHYHLFSNDKGLRGLNWKGLAIARKDVKQIMFSSIPRSINTAETVWVTFFLKDGRSFETHFEFYGKANKLDIIHHFEQWNQQNTID
jgi:hypothetical protein